MSKRAITITIVPVFVLCAMIFGIFSARGSTQDEINARNQQIEEIQKQIEEYQQQLDTLGGQSLTLKNTIDKLNAEIGQVQLEIKSLNLSIVQTNSAIGQTQTQIQIAQAKINLQKATLAKLITELYQTDQQNLTEIFFKNETLSDFFHQVDDIRNAQNNIQTVLDSIKTTKSDLEEKEADLEDKQNELERQQNLQQLEKNSLDKAKNQQATLLKQTKNQESKFQDLVKKSQKDIEAIRSQITYLQQNGVTAEDAIKFGHLAAIGAGIRPAFLIAEAEQESALGNNVGKCYIVDKTSGATRRVTNGQNYAKGIHPTRDLPLFLQITAELGLDPFKTPVSCGSGWGGAMGLAQFIPSTWMGYREIVTRITGHSIPNPWNIEDAFVAAAAKLSKDGASSQTRAGEIAASKKYYCGSASSKSASCINYANSVQRLATEIEKNL